jgi:hypothetical protein
MKASPLMRAPLVLYMANLNIAEQYMRLILRKSCTLGVRITTNMQYPESIFHHLFMRRGASHQHEKRHRICSFFIGISSKRAAATKRTPNVRAFDAKFRLFTYATVELNSTLSLILNHAFVRCSAYGKKHPHIIHSSIYKAKT